MAYSNITAYKCNKIIKVGGMKKWCTQNKPLKVRVLNKAGKTSILREILISRTFCIRVLEPIRHGTSRTLPRTSLNSTQHHHTDRHTAHNTAVAKIFCSLLDKTVSLILIDFKQLA
jgi:hypothetical protein